MRQLNEFEKAWRDYLFANRNSFYNNADDFFTVVELISDSQDQILEAMLRDEPDMEIVSDCKEEIAFQRRELSEVIGEFIVYYNDHVSQAKTVDMDEILDSLCLEGTSHCLYRIAENWKEWGKKARHICDRLNDSYGCGSTHLHDNLCKLILEEVCDGKHGAAYENAEG